MDSSHVLHESRSPGRIVAVAGVALTLLGGGFWLGRELGSPDPGGALPAAERPAATTRLLALHPPPGPPAPPPPAVPAASAPTASATSLASTRPERPAAKAARTPSPERLEVRRLVVTRAVQDREPVPAESLAADGAPLYAFLELANAAPEEQAVVVTFEREGGPSVGHVVLRVPAETKRWRTWAFTRGATRPGDWVAVVRSADGRELGRVEFFLQG